MCYVTVSRAEDIAKAIREVEPFVRAHKMKRQIAKFKADLGLPRKRLHYVISRARKILGISL